MIILDKDIIEIKNKITDNNFSSREERLEYCNLFLKYSLEENNQDDIAYAYLSLASYYANVVHDTNMLNKYMKKARKYLSNEPSPNLIIYHTLKALNDNTTFDLLSRLDSYLEIIRVADILGVPSKAYFAYGNIAELFRLCQDYETALEYSIETYEKYKSNSENYTNNKVITLTNIVELLNYTNKVDEIPFYIKEIEKLNWNSKVYPILLNICYLRLYSMRHDNENVITTNEKLLDLIRSFPSSKSFKYDCVVIMIEAMMHINAFEEVQKLITFMEETFEVTDINEWLQIQKIKIEYFKETQDEESLKQQYLNYFRAYERVEKEKQATKILGIRAHIEIQDILKHEKKLLVDNKSLKNESMIDVMTQLYNRRYINTFFLNIVNDTSINTLGFAIFDVDYFKEYNDTYGHLMGDQVLVDIANILKSTDNPNIKPCRFGGDEFVCIFTNMTDVEIESYIIGILEKLKKKAIHHSSSKCSNEVTLSIGYGVSNLDKNFNYKNLLENIDTVLYNSKRKGRNTYTKYTNEGDDNEK